MEHSDAQYKVQMVKKKYSSAVLELDITLYMTSTP